MSGETQATRRSHNPGPFTQPSAEPSRPRGPLGCRRSSKSWRVPGYPLRSFASSRVSAAAVPAPGKPFLPRSLSPSLSPLNLTNQSSSKRSFRRGRLHRLFGFPRRMSSIRPTRTLGTGRRDIQERRGGELAERTSGHCLSQRGETPHRCIALRRAAHRVGVPFPLLQPTIPCITSYPSRRP